jgi:hypothetical protein
MRGIRLLPLNVDTLGLRAFLGLAATIEAVSQSPIGESLTSGKLKAYIEIDGLKYLPGSVVLSVLCFFW